MGIAHWDDVEPRDLRRGPMQLDRIDLGHAAGTKDVGVARLKIDPGGRSSPVHVELDEEEIFYVLAGSGLSWQSGKTYEVRAGDTIVHRVAEEDHTLIAGPDGLDVLAFGERTNATASYLTRAGVLRMDATVKVAEDRHPWDLEADAGDLELPEPSPRPSNIVNLDDVEGDGGSGWAERAGSERTGLNWVVAGERGRGPVHCHSEDEEIFVVLEGIGTLVLWPTPRSVPHNAAERRRSIVRTPATSSRGLPAPGSPITSARTTRRYLPRLRHPQAERHLLLPALEQDLLSWRRPHRPARDLDYYDGEPS